MSKPGHREGVQSLSETHKRSHKVTWSKRGSSFSVSPIKKTRAKAITLELVQTYLCQIGTPKANAISICLHYGDFDALQSISMNPSDYLDLEIWFNRSHFPSDWSAFHIVRKCDGLRNPKDLMGLTLAKWSSAEAANLETNRRLTSELPEKDVASVLYRMQRKIAYWTDDNPFSCVGGFGPGVTQNCRDRNVHIWAKFDAIPECTPSCHGLLQNLLWMSPTWVESIIKQPVEGPTSVLNISSARYSELKFVPKDWKSLRGIEVGPTGNIFCQKMLGQFLSRCLAQRAKLDIERQQPVNQALARRASLDNSLATEDQESASDRIAYQVVRMLFPHWLFDMMVACRTSVVSLGTGSEKEVRLPHHKFAAMGNCFTFEMETMIFLALAISVVEECGVQPRWATTDPTDVNNIGVYGDDVIIPVECLPLFRKVSAWLGFKTNVDKSFSSGPFRESCGGDYWKGIKVSPLRVTGLLETPLQFVELANRLRTYSLCNGICDARFVKPWLFIINTLRSIYPIFYKFGPFYGPDELIWVSLSERKVDLLYDDDIQAVQVRYWANDKARFNRSDLNDQTYLTAGLYRCGFPISRDTRGSTSRYRPRTQSINHPGRCFGIWS